MKRGSSYKLKITIYIILNKNKKLTKTISTENFHVLSRYEERVKQDTKIALIFFLSDINIKI